MNELRARSHVGEARVRVNLLGGFEVTAGGRSWDMPSSCQRLLVYLVLRGRPQHRTVVAGSLWPDKTEGRAAANLRASLWRLPTPAGVNLVDSTGPSIQVSRELAIDVREAEAVGWALVADPTSLVNEVDSSLFLQELLPGWYDDWVMFERERVAQLQVRFLEALTYALVERDRLTKALDIALRLVNVDPLREASQRALLTVYRAEGSFEQARRQFETYRQLIQDTFGCDPSPTLRSMVIARA